LPSSPSIAEVVASLSLLLCDILEREQEVVVPSSNGYPLIDIQLAVPKEVIL
jgi:hypothetical protein